MRDPEGPCTFGAPGEIIGYARVSVVWFKEQGETWRIRGTKTVVSPRPGEGVESSAVCTLRAGDEVRLVHAREGRYVPIAGASVTASPRKASGAD